MLRSSAASRAAAVTWQSIANAALAALLAPTCATCDGLLARPLDGAVCPACWTRLPRFTPPVCAICGWPLPAGPDRDRSRTTCHRCGVHLPGVAAARAVGPFEGQMVEIVHALKYARRPSVSGPLSTLMRHAAADLLAGVDLVVPVPLHPRRERERGFNQAEALARGLGPPVCRALRRPRIATPQAALSGRARRENVRQAFAVGPEAGRVTGRVVALVDDVLTTGATLGACAAALAAAGPIRIVAVTAARVDRPPSG